VLGYCRVRVSTIFVAIHIKSEDDEDDEMDEDEDD